MKLDETKIEYLESCLKSADWNVKQNRALLKEAWQRIDYLEGREAELMGKLFDALHNQKPQDPACSECGKPRQEGIVCTFCGKLFEEWSTEEILKREG